MEALLERQKEDKVLPIVLVHGLKQQGSDIKSTTELLQELAPGTKIYTPDLSLKGFMPCELSTRELANFINDEPKLADGFNLIGYSLGGVIARGVVEEGSLKSRAYSLVTIASPHRGVCGFPYEWDDRIDEEVAKHLSCTPCRNLEKQIHKAMYKKYLQNLSSIANIWNEPGKHSTYLKENTFLPLYNNEKQHKNSAAFKHNLTSLLVFTALAAQEDKTLEPWQSGMFDYVEKNHKDYAPVTQTAMYEELGLKEMEESDSLHRVAVTDEGHGSIRDDRATFINHILPSLSRESHVDHDTGKNFYEEMTETNPIRSLMSCCK
jgi:palmitoyl-protein thioesterase